MISPELDELRKAYVAELRESKSAAERWWAELKARYDQKPEGLKPDDLWPMGPASHPWVIATYRKYYFLCLELNRRTSNGAVESAGASAANELDWGGDEPEPKPAATVEPAVFVLDLLSGGDTQDLYEFLLCMVFVPVGLKADELV